MIDDFDLRLLVEPLQSWFPTCARKLPWRDDPRAYYVWISEIMLQQTRVEAVLGYFDRFIRELPTVEALAKCPEDKLLKLWEGLGYYNRVRNLKLAAQQIMEEYGGVIPSDYDALLRLKGIGHYTAGAIASIAYEKPYPAVDGNVLRVLSRVTGDDSDIMKQSVRNHVEERLYELMQNGCTRTSSEEDVNPCVVRPRIFNQALMELGALICVPNGQPHCAKCPWQELCVAKKEGRINELPVKKKAKERRIEEKTVLIIRDGERIVLGKRPNKGLLAGLYELPNLPGKRNEREVLDYAKELGLMPLRIQPLPPAKHIFSHVEWHMIGYMVSVANMEVPEAESMHRDWLLVETEAVKEHFAIPSAFGAYVSYMNIPLGGQKCKNK